jgi:AcrR family transcriptional regulator
MLTGRNTADRRVQKTQELLRAALRSLIGEKPYDSIVVKEILDRANVGRSTFYSHFQDKDDLLVSGIHDMLRPLQSPGSSASGNREERILWFSLPIFEYHYQHRHPGGDRVGARGRAILHEHLRRVLAGVIADVAKKDFRTARKGAPRQIPTDLLSEHIASTFVLVLNWWLARKMFVAPKEINDVFHRLILPSLAATTI